MAESTEREVLTLPDFEDTEATRAFITRLEGESTRHGVKKLLGHCEAILGYKEKIAENIEQAEKVLPIVNGVRTPSQVVRDKTRMYRHTAERFYSTLDSHELQILCGAFQLTDCLNLGRETCVEMLVEHYITWRLQGE